MIKLLRNKRSQNVSVKSLPKKGGTIQTHQSDADGSERFEGGF